MSNVTANTYETKVAKHVKTNLRYYFTKKFVCVYHSDITDVSLLLMWGRSNTAGEPQIKQKSVWCETLKQLEQFILLWRLCADVHVKHAELWLLTLNQCEA